MDLCKLAEFSPSGPVKKDPMKTAGSNLVLVSPGSGQGEGVITSGTVQNPSSRIGEKEEDRGIRCDQKMVLLGNREDE